MNQNCHVEKKDITEFLDSMFVLAMGTIKDDWWAALLYAAGSKMCFVCRKKLILVTTNFMVHVCFVIYSMFPCVGQMAEQDNCDAALA
jgi:hypothetical protein